MFCCQIDEVSSGQKIQYQQTPLKLKIIQSLGLSNFVLNNFVFAKPQINYSSTKAGEQTILMIQQQPYTAPQGYRYSYFVLNNQNHSVPVAHLKYDQQKAKSTIIYSHGNASNISQSLRFISSLAQIYPADYIAYDYTGYGNSQIKQTTQITICQDLEIVLSWLSKPLDQIIFIGFSLGCYPTAKIAAKHKIKAVILLAPMASLISIFQQKLTPFTFFKDDHFNLLEIVQNIQSHILLAHSRDDQLIPFRHSQIIYERYAQISKNPSIQLIQLKHIHHNDMHRCLISSHQNSFKRKFFGFLKKLQEKTTVQHYIYSRKKLQSEKEGRLSKQIKQLLKKDSLNRQKQHNHISKNQLQKIKSMTKIVN